MSLKVGQKVRLKSLEVCEGIDGLLIVPEMYKHFGTIVTIASFDWDGDINIKESKHWWSPEWFGEIPTINLKDIV